MNQHIPPPLATREEIQRYYQKQLFSNRASPHILRTQNLLSTHNKIKNAPKYLFDSNFDIFNIEDEQHLNEVLIIRSQSLVAAAYKEVIDPATVAYWSDALIYITNKLTTDETIKTPININLRTRKITPK